ncbi:enoyl-CoA hydratase [Zavarzinia compransoris]|uniref:Enoyl-CoA hydratase n=1 Tax=Zavarzinia compransoris TaxID=1264899 RepID=A0A317E6H8_9PROT|nr:enoyl-CoA hydratase [Zavarzinia compransoris]PWR22231.1 enoyl-CoA hydratase [Zavarzinia compransoris]TDP47012.1 enoyl-CoA hydratase/carnithine racemase [Zavarzinia compransoris]
MTDLVLTEVRDGIMTVTMNRADKKNAITLAMYDGIVGALAQAAADTTVRVVVLTGAGTAFTAGNDLVDFMQNPPDLNGESPVSRFLAAISTFPKILIAAVNGVAVGVGTTLLLHCDLVYAADTARFSLPFTALGLVPEAASSLLVPAMIGHRKAAELFLFGDQFDAARAADLGFVNEVVPAADLAGHVAAKAARLTALSPSALRLTKQLMKSQTPAVAGRMKEEGAIFGELLRGPEVAEAIGAFFEKRKPDFSQFAA